MNAGRLATAPTPLAPPSSAVARSQLNRRRRRLVVATWGGLFFNVLAFGGTAGVLPIPKTVGQALTQGSLLLALVFILSANPRGIMAPQVFLVVLTVIGVIAAMVSLHSEFLVGSMFRATRFLGFLLVLWLLTPWFRRRDMILLRAHRIWLWAVLVSVLLGAMMSPHLAFAFQGRLSGVLWPIPPTQVAHYAAILFGTTAVLWMTRVISGGTWLVTAAHDGGVLVASTPERRWSPLGAD